MLYKQPGSSVWHYEFQIAGQRFRGSTGERDRKEADKEARRIRVEKEAAAPERRARGIGPLSALSAADLDRATAQGATKAWRYTLEHYWINVLAHFGAGADISRIGFEEAQGYIAARRKEKVRGQTIVRELAALHRAMEIAKRRGWLRALPDEWPVVKRDAPDEKKRGKFHPIEIIRLVLADISPEARDACTFCLLTGLRSAELRRVRADWVEPAPKGSAVKAILRLPAASTKSRRERIVGLSDQALAIIKRRADKDPIFPQGVYRKTLAAACRRLKYNQVITMRDLRHTYATLSLAGGSDPVATQSALGHKDLRTTQIYLSSTITRSANVSANVAKLLNAPGKRSKTA